MSEIITHDVLDSTNDEARRLASAGAESGTVVVAREQRAGRGRLGRTWHSPDAGNLYLSLIHRSSLSPDALSGITLDAAVAVADVLETAGLTTGLKWPNDLIVEDRKVGGILTELVVDGGQAIVIIGLGLNVNATVEDFPPELHSIATSMAIETGESHDLDWLARRLSGTLRSKLAAFEVRGIPDLRAYAMRDILQDEAIEYEAADGRRPGIVQGINESGALLVTDLVDGHTVTVRSGEVTQSDIERDP
jgi:BirA family biotin operon repressor/biotin-[acetyl-CoA-carboxylase] ligase